jgi:hypothetical protein
MLYLRHSLVREIQEWIALTWPEPVIRYNPIDARSA